MTERKNLTAIAAAAALLGLAGCATGPGHIPATQATDAEFLRGCWVAKTAPGGTVTGFLRLLPEGAAGAAYQGQVGGMGDGRSGPFFSFKRDGSAAQTALAADAPQKAYRKTSYELLVPQADSTTYAAYAEEGAPDNRLIAEVTSERLMIHTLSSAGKDDVLFNGERDGCD